jgi:hypothetical protein
LELRAAIFSFKDEVVFTINRKMFIQGLRFYAEENMPKVYQNNGKLVMVRTQALFSRSTIQLGCSCKTSHDLIDQTSIKFA